MNVRESEVKRERKGGGKRERGGGKERHFIIYMLLATMECHWPCCAVILWKC